MAIWEPDEDQRLLQLVDEFGERWNQIADHIPGRSADSVRHRYKRLTELEQETGELNNHIEPIHRIVYDPSQSADWRERIQLAARVKDVRDRDKPFCPIADVEIKTDKPIAVLVTSDWQLGSLGVDYQTWYNHMSLFLELDNFYMIVNGDLISNTYMHKTLSAVWSQVMSPEEQALLVGSIAKEMVEKKKILAITLSEEHDQKDERATGRAGILDMLRDKGVPLFDNRGTLVLRVGECIYVIYCVHRSRFGSSFNQLHSGYREFSLGVPANVVVTSHRHQPADGRYPWYPELRMLMDYLELPIRLGGKVHIIQTGTYETESDFGTRFFGRGAMPELQILILRPDQFSIIQASSFEEARRDIGDFSLGASSS
jgi:hypothetical protein